MRHVMYDHETWGLSRGNAIRSISAVPFDPYTGWIAPREQWFHQNVDFASQEVIGLTKDPETVAWWDKPEQANANKLLEPDQTPLIAALMWHDRWLKNQFGWDSDLSDVRPWARGQMDIELFEGLYQAVGRKFPFHFRTPRDTRNFHDLMEYSIDLQMSLPDFEGVPHFGPDDAYNECRLINRIFEFCGLRRFGPPEYSGYAEVVGEVIEADQAQKFADIAEVAERPAPIRLDTPDVRSYRNDIDEPSP